MLSYKSALTQDTTVSLIKTKCSYTYVCMDLSFFLTINSSWAFLGFQDELSLSLESLQEKLESLKRMQQTTAGMVQYIKVTLSWDDRYLIFKHFQRKTR